MTPSSRLPEAMVQQDLLLAQYLRKHSQPYPGLPLRPAFLHGSSGELPWWVLRPGFPSTRPPLTPVNLQLLGWRAAFSTETSTSFLTEWLSSVAQQATAGLEPPSSAVTPEDSGGMHRSPSPWSVGPPDSASSSDYSTDYSSFEESFFHYIAGGN
eukprot:RCo002488